MKKTRLLGAAMAAVGFNITHDANHGAFSNKKWINVIMSHIMDLVGGSCFVWRTQHNIIHHTFTNILNAFINNHIVFVKSFGNNVVITEPS